MRRSISTTVWAIGTAFVVVAAGAGAVRAWAQTTLWTEQFDAAVAPALPAGWTAEGTGWETNASSASPGSGGNNLMHRGTVPGTIETPVLNLSGVVAADLVFLARRTASYDAANLAITASADGGASYPITLLDGGLALPAVDSRYEELRVPLPGELLGNARVRVRFQGAGGSSTLASARIDDVRLEGEGTVMQTTFGFRAERDTLLGAPGPITIPLALRLVEAPAGLQGLQFVLRYDTTFVSRIVAAPGPAVSGPSWRLETEDIGGELRVVLLGDGIERLDVGLYDPLLNLDAFLAESPVAYETTLALDGVIGAAGTPTADDLPVLAGFATLTLRQEPSIAVFQADADTLDFGTVRAGMTAEAPLRVSNVGGTVALVIDSVRVGDPLFGVAPDSVSIAPDESFVFQFIASPVLADVGVRSTFATFFHNADGATDDVHLRLLVSSGRGDVNQDYVVDVLDLVLGIDLALGRMLPIVVDSTAADLYPFPSGDGAIDVRDLTVLSQALLLGQWPDDVPIDESPAASKGGAGQVPASSDMAVVLVQSQDGLVVSLESRRPLRAAHILLDLPDGPGSKSGAYRTGVIRHAALQAGKRTDGVVSVLAYRIDGLPIPAGSYRLIDLPDVVAGSTVGMVGATVVGEDLVKRTPATLWKADSQPPLPDHDDRPLTPPFPNPFRPADGSTRISVDLGREGRAKLEIFDVRGVAVRLLHDGLLEAGNIAFDWDGKTDAGSRVPPGVYLIRLYGPEGGWTRKVVVLR